MKHPYLILAIILMVTLLLIFDRLELKDRRMRDGSAIKDPADGLLPEDKVLNDKLIVVEGMNEDQVKKIIRDFCGWHNREMLQLIPVVTKMTDQLFVITFPYDVSFDIFCFFISYLNYPKGYNRRFHTMGWSTTRLADMWMTEEIAGKQVLLFVPDLETAYDRVLMTTADQTTYQLGFAEAAAQLRQYPDMPYRMPLFTAHDLMGRETIVVSFNGR